MISFVHAVGHRELPFDPTKTDAVPNLYRGYVWAERIDCQSVRLPADWFEHVKERWLPAGMRRRWPVRYLTYEIGVWRVYAFPHYHGIARIEFPMVLASLPLPSIMDVTTTVQEYRKTQAVKRPLAVLLSETPRGDSYQAARDATRIMEESLDAKYEIVYPASWLDALKERWVPARLKEWKWLKPTMIVRTFDPATLDYPAVYVGYPTRLAVEFTRKEE